MSFRLTNALIVFINLMNGILIYFLDFFLIVYIDDILVYTKSKEEHVSHLCLVLGILMEK